MADMGKLEGNAHAEKRKFDLPNIVDGTFEQKDENKDDESESRKRQKQAPTENETEAIHSFLIGGKMEEIDDGKEDPKIAEGNAREEHLNGEPEIGQRRPRYTAEEKGKTILVEESDEDDDEDDYYDDDSSSESSDSDFSDDLDSGSEDIPF